MVVFTVSMVFIPLEQKTNLSCIKKYVKIEIFLYVDVIRPPEDTKILELNQYQKSDKAPFITYADLEFWLEKIDGSKNDPQNSFTTKVGEHILSSFRMFTRSSFTRIENKRYVYRGKDCMKKFCESLRGHAMKKINYKIIKISY